MATDSSDSEAEQVLKPTQGRKRKRDEVSDNESSGGDNEESEVNPSMFRINPLNVIKNKEIRKKLFKKQQQQKKKAQKRARRQRKEEGGPRSTGHTIESLREADHTTVENLEDSDQEELKLELENDEFSEYFNREYEPKVLITYADNPVTKKNPKIWH